MTVRKIRFRSSGMRKILASDWNMPDPLTGCDGAAGGLDLLPGGLAEPIGDDVKLLGQLAAVLALTSRASRMAAASTLASLSNAFSSWETLTIE